MARLLISFLAVLTLHAESTHEQESEYPACKPDGVRVNGTFGTISSPNYPGNYPDDVTCTWTIQVLEGMRIAVRFESLFFLESFLGNFCYDDLSFSETGMDYVSYCNDNPSFVTITNVLQVKFKTDAFVNFAGFSFNWTAVTNTSVPDPVFTMIESDNGTLSSPNYPNVYEPFLSYSWVISTSPEKYIMLEFESVFGIEESSGTNCPYDSLVISEGSIQPSLFSYKQQFCGSTPPSRLLFKNHEVYIVFKSDIIINGVGFSFNFTAIDPPRCHGFTQQNGTSGVVSTPLYPIAYDEYQDCFWEITAPENTLIAVRFNTPFSIATSFKCISDFLQIFDGPDADSNLQYLGQNSCGESAPRGFLSTSNQLFVRFQSQTIGTTDNIGFSFNWTAEAKCASDQFHCWDGTCINGTAKCNGMVECPADYADEAVCSDENTTKCGIAEVSPVYKWTARLVGGHEAQKGSWPWQGQFQVLYQRSWSFGCGAVLISNEWAITAAHCIKKGLVSVVTFGDHDLAVYDPEAEQNATVDRIFVGSAYNHTKSGHVNGSDLAMLHLSPPINYTKWVKPVCLAQSPPTVGEYLVLSGWGVTRPGDESEQKVDVLRQVRVPVTTRKVCDKTYGFELSDTIFCAGLPAGGASGCTGDSGGPAVRLRNSSWEIAGMSSFGRQCGTLAGKPSAFVNIYALLPFISNVLENGMQEVPITNFVVRDKQRGVITSPNYGSKNYPPGMHTRWNIIGPKNKRIEIRFNSNFSIEESLYGVRCSGDYLLVYDGSTTISVKYRNKKLCGKFPPPNFVSNSNIFIVEFYSDYSFQSTGFSLTWQAVDDCGDDHMRCWDQTCIPKEKKCDGVGDCSGNEDEFECATAKPGSIVCGKAEISPEFPFTPLVAGGHNAKEGSWPWQVAVTAESQGQYEYTCMGSLVDEQWAITAAHCLGSNKYQVIIGAYDYDALSPHRKRINVSYEFIPSEYTGGIADIGFLKLAEKVDFSSKWYKPICLPPPDDTGPPINTTCVISGWGRTGNERTQDNPRIMQQTHVRILNDTACTAWLASLSAEQKRHFICAGHEHERAGSCHGDSGSPLACLVNGSWTNYGVLAFGTTHCGARSFYQRVSLFLDFFEEAKAMEACSDLEVREGSAGTVKPPIIQGSYLAETNCSWLLRGPSNTVLVLKFDESFSIESCTSGLFDYLNIYDGNSTADRKVFDDTLCGTNRTIRAFESSTNEVLINFVSDSSDQYGGFMIMWEAIANCESDQFRCWDGSCIKQSSKCDVTEDCADASDEKECTHRGLQCGKQDVAPRFLWAPRISGGSFAENGSWPFQAQVINGGNICGGTILNERWILSSFACVTFASVANITVVVGEIGREDVPDTSKYAVVEWHAPDKADDENGFDIALLKLNRSISFSSTVQPACMALPNTTEALESGEVCVVLGWGRTHYESSVSRWLRQTRVPALDQNTCEKSWETSYSPTRMLCSGSIIKGGVGACYDQGGPLMCLRNDVWVQFGVVSSFFGCGVPGSPDYFTKVSFHIGWIEQKIGEQLPVHPGPQTTKAIVTTVQAQETATTTTVQAQETATATSRPSNPATDTIQQTTAIAAKASSTASADQTTSTVPVSTKSSCTKIKASLFALTCVVMICSFQLYAF